MASTIKCVALVAFTQFVSGYGMIHGNPDAKDAKFPLVPEDSVERFVEAGYIEAPEIEAPTGAFEMKHIKFGNYLITGPGVEPDTIINGKKDAEAYLALLVESAQDAGEDAPV